MVLPDSLGTRPDGLVYLSRPVDLVDTDGNLARPFTYPLNTWVHSIRLHRDKIHAQGEYTYMYTCVHVYMYMYIHMNSYISGLFYHVPD